MTLSLEDATGAIKAYVWTENLKIDFKEYDLVKARGTIRSFNGSWIASLQHADLVKDVRTNPAALLPQSICPLPALLARLDALPRALKTGGSIDLYQTFLPMTRFHFPSCHCQRAGNITIALQVASWSTALNALPWLGDLPSFRRQSWN